MNKLNKKTWFCVDHFSYTNFDPNVEEAIEVAKVDLAFLIATYTFAEFELVLPEEEGFLPYIMVYVKNRWEVQTFKDLYGLTVVPDAEDRYWDAVATNAERFAYD